MGLRVFNFLDQLVFNFDGRFYWVQSSLTHIICAVLVNSLLFGLSYLSNSFDILDVSNWLEFLNRALVCVRNLELRSPNFLLLTSSVSFVNELDDLLAISSSLKLNILISCARLLKLVNDLWQLRKFHRCVLLGVRLFDSIRRHLRSHIHI